jgi:hypothetical protein
MKQRRCWPLLATAIVIAALAGCDEFEVPITAGPTRNIEPALLGDWMMTEEKEGDSRKYSRDRLRIRSFDRFTYVVEHNESLYRAWHSDVDGIPLVTLQSLDSDERKYQYWSFDVTADGSELTLRAVNSDGSMSKGVIPSQLPDSAAAAASIRKHREDPRLFAGKVKFLK